MKMNKKMTYLLLLSCSLLLGSCGGNDDDNIIPQEDVRTSPNPSPAPLNVATKQDLSNIVFDLIGKNFSCDQGINFSECRTAAQNIVTAFKNDTAINTIVTNIIVDFNDDLSKKRTLKLSYDDSQDRMRTQIRNHYSNWSNQDTNEPTPSDNFQALAQSLQNSAGMDLSCRVQYKACEKGVKRFLKAYSQSNRTKRLTKLIVERNRNAGLNQQGVLFIAPNTSVKAIKSLITLDVIVTPPTPPSNPGMTTLREVQQEIRNISDGKQFLCDTQINTRSCIRVGKKIIQAYQVNPVQTRLKQFFATPKPTRSTQSSFNTMEISTEDTVQSIIKKLIAHDRRW